MRTGPGGPTPPATRATPDWPRLFFSEELQDIAAAKRICAECPVLADLPRGRARSARAVGRVGWTAPAERQDPRQQAPPGPAPEGAPAGGSVAGHPDPRAPADGVERRSGSRSSRLGDGETAPGRRPDRPASAGCLAGTVMTRSCPPTSRLPNRPAAAPDPGSRQLDRRTVGISVLIALIARARRGAWWPRPLDAGTTSDASAVRHARPSPPRPRSTRRRRCGTRIARRSTAGATTLAAHVRNGRPTVVNFFSTTCTPCVTEMPALERVHRSRRDVSFVGIDVQDQVGSGTQADQADRHHLRGPARPSRRSAAKPSAASACPTTVLIDRNGRVVDTHTGALTERALVSLIQRKLG